MEKIIRKTGGMVNLLWGFLRENQICRFHISIVKLHSFIQSLRLRALRDVLPQSILQI